MIIGLGLDLCRIDRVKRFIERYDQRFLKRCFTEDEIIRVMRYANNAEQFAGCIAVKEAASKALGTGWRRGVHWKNFDVAHYPSGKPYLRVHGRAAELMAEMGVKHVNITITHDAGIAAAVVIFEGE